MPEGSLLPPPPRFGAGEAFDPFALHKKLQEQQQRFASAIKSTGPNSIYEMAALTQELNTLQLTTRVRETLAANNIGQKVKSFLHYNLRNEIHKNYLFRSFLVKQFLGYLKDQ